MDKEESGEELLPQQNLPEITIVSGTPGITTAKAGRNEGPGVPVPKPKNMYTLTIDYTYPWN